MTDPTDRRPVLGDPKEIAESGALLLTPWRRVLLDPAYAGCWVVAGDVDGDGEVELVSAQNHNEDDVHYTSTAVAQRLDGTVLWRWGDPTIGRKRLHHDVACQIHDWDGDGQNEVVLATDGAIVELDGATGRERRRLPIPPGTSDCLTFARLSGRPQPDVLVKTRYTEILAYACSGELLWRCEMPGGYRTAHQPRPLDIDGDGRDEIMAGYALLNADGSVRWVYRSRAVDPARGHLDTVRVLRAGTRPAEWRLAVTLCGAGNLAVIDGEGQILWEVPGHHFESLSIGRLCPAVPGPQIAVDIDHVPWGQSPVWVFDADGHQISAMTTVYSRCHHLIDWDGSGVLALAIAQPRGVFTCHGERLATLDLRLPDGEPDTNDVKLAVGDLTGNGVPDLLVTTPRAAYVFPSPGGAPSDLPLGTGPNFTYY